MFGKHIYSDKADFSFFQINTSFLVLIKRTINGRLPDVYLFAVFARNGINSVGAFLAQYSRDLDVAMTTLRMSLERVFEQRSNLRYLVASSTTVVPSN